MNIHIPEFVVFGVKAVAVVVVLGLAIVGGVFIYVWGDGPNL